MSRPGRRSSPSEWPVMLATGARRARIERRPSLPIRKATRRTRSSPPIRWRCLSRSSPSSERRTGAPTTSSGTRSVSGIASRLRPGVGEAPGLGPRRHHGRSEGQRPRVPRDAPRDDPHAHLQVPEERDLFSGWTKPPTDNGDKNDPSTDPGPSMRRSPPRSRSSRTTSPTSRPTTSSGSTSRRRSVRRPPTRTRAPPTRPPASTTTSTTDSRTGTARLTSAIRR